MESTIKQVLQRLVEWEAFADGKSAKTFLNDAVGGLSDKKKIGNLLNFALVDMRSYSRLGNAVKNGIADSAIDSLAEEMYQNYSIDVNDAKIIMKCVAELHGYTSSTNVPVPSQNKQPKVKPSLHLPTVNHINVSDITSFGGYDWRVLDIQGSEALIVTENIIEQRAYHHSYVAITWEKCELREYLNGDFLDNNFNSVELAKIIPRINKNPNNPWWGTNGGADTEDKVFLLSTQEVCRYFGDSRAELNSPAKKALATELKSEYWGKGKTKWKDWKDFFLDNEVYVSGNKQNRTAKYGNEASWWLRSPGSDGSRAADVNSGGCVGVDGGNVDRDGGGVRPALWLNLES